MGAEPTKISLEWLPAHNLGSAKDISSVTTNYAITGLEPNTSYRITANFTDACGSVLAEIFASTMQSTGESCFSNMAYIIIECNKLLPLIETNSWN